MMESILVGSLKTAFAATVFALFIGLPFACWSRKRRGGISNAFAALLLFPVAVSPTVLGLVLVMIFGRNSTLGAGLDSLCNLILCSWPAAVIVGAVVSFPLVYQGAKRALEQIDDTLVDTMRMFGFSGIPLFWKILLPLAWPGILAGVVLGFVRALGEYGAFIMLVAGFTEHPESTQTICTGEIALSALFIALALLVNRLPAHSASNPRF